MTNFVPLSLVLLVSLVSEAFEDLVYSKVSGEPTIDVPMIDISFKEFYGKGYDDSDKRIPDMTIINKQLGWDPKTSLWDLLELTLTYQHRTYVEAVKQAIVKPVASS